MDLSGADLSENIWTDEEVGIWLALDACTGCGLRTVRLKQVFERLGSLQTFWTASADELHDMAGSAYGLAWINDDFIGKFLARRAQRKGPVEPAPHPAESSKP